MDPLEWTWLEWDWEGWETLGSIATIAAAVATLVIVRLSYREINKNAEQLEQTLKANAAEKRRDQHRALLIEIAQLLRPAMVSPSEPAARQRMTTLVEILPVDVAPLHTIRNAFGLINANPAEGFRQAPGVVDVDALIRHMVSEVAGAIARLDGDSFKVNAYAQVAGSSQLTGDL